MIPDIQERLARLEKENSEQDARLHDMAENLKDLRVQLQVERSPQIAVSTPANCATPSRY